MSDITTPGSTVRTGILITIAMLVVVASCAGPVPEVPAGSDGTPDPVLVQGRDVYSGRCQSCHGADGGGGSGPGVTGNDLDDDLSEIADLIEVIATGRNRMPAFEASLSEAEIEAVARYMREVL